MSSLSFTRPLTFSSPCNFVWDGLEADYSNGTILILTFELPEEAEAGTVYGIDISYTWGNLIGGDLEAIDMEIDNGSITIIETVGDVNGDGIVNVVDVIALRRYLAGYGNEINESAADMNHDGWVTVADVILLRRTLVD